MRGKTGKFSIDALVDMLERAGKHVTVQVSNINPLEAKVSLIFRQNKYFNY
jgi:hypothetical protein